MEIIPPPLCCRRHPSTERRTLLYIAEYWGILEYLHAPRGSQRVWTLPAETHIRANYLEARLRLLPDSLAVHQEWRQLLVTQNVSGVRVHDARLVAAMQVHGVKRILTFNEKDFARYLNIEAINPRHSLFP